MNQHIWVLNQVLSISSARYLNFTSCVQSGSSRHIRTVNQKERKFKGKRRVD